MIREEETGLAVIDEPEVDSKTMEQVMLAGDLSKLAPAKRLEYYSAVCRSLGLNPLTQPFAYLTFQGKMRLYALRDCTDQLRRLHKVSVEIVKRDKIGEIYVVTARASMPDGRFDESTGAVFLGTKHGEELANLYMRGETKAKRRCTLSICGLGWLDETEAETLPRIERPATRIPEPPTVEAEQEADDIRAFLLKEISTSLKVLVPGATAEDKSQRLRLIQDAFDVKGWPRVERLSVEKLQSGYRYLQEQIQAQEAPDDEDDIPEADTVTDTAIPETPDAPEPPPAGVYASAADVAKVVDYANAHHLGSLVDAALRHYPNGVTPERLAQIEANLKDRVDAAQEHDEP